jgi:hypothetical protein
MLGSIEILERSSFGVILNLLYSHSNSTPNPEIIKWAKYTSKITKGEVQVVDQTPIYKARTRLLGWYAIPSKSGYPPFILNGIRGRVKKPFKVQ